MAFVEATGLVKTYPSAQALRGLDLSLEAGSWCSIMGRSGSGKSTFINILAGLESPTGGHVLLDDTDITALSEDALARLRREQIGLVFQRSHLLPYLDCVENVMLAQYFHSMADEAEARAALERVGLGARLSHRPSELSGGEQQRVGIARALVNRPRLLLADEPTGNLDVASSRNVLSLLREVHAAEDLTIVLVTHDPLVARWSDRVVTLEDGRVVDDRAVGPEERTR